MKLTHNKLNYLFSASVIILIGFLNINAAAQSLVLTSPSGKVKVEIENKANLTYQVSLDGKIIIRESPMGFQFKNEPDMGADLQLTSQNEREIKENWRPVLKAKYAIVTDHCKELKLSFVEKSGLLRKIDLEFRAYDDGVAFRYQLYRSERIGNRHITKELTGFNLPGDPKAWVASSLG